MTENIKEIRRLLNRLSREDLEQLNAEITEKLEGYGGLADFLNRCAEQRFADMVWYALIVAKRTLSSLEKQEESRDCRSHNDV